MYTLLSAAVKLRRGDGRSLALSARTSRGVPLFLIPIVYHLLFAFTFLSFSHPAGASASSSLRYRVFKNFCNSLVRKGEHESGIFRENSVPKGFWNNSFPKFLWNATIQIELFLSAAFLSERLKKRLSMEYNNVPWSALFVECWQ